jgi:hypothetical protein
VYSKTHWVQRRLTAKELCDGLNIPACVSRKGGAKAGEMLKDIPVPGKVISYLLAGIRGNYEASNDGGSSLKRAGEVLEKGAKAARINEDEEMEYSESKANRERPVEDEGPSLKQCKIAELGDYHKEPSTVSSKAVKSNNAGIPEYLWNEEVLKKFPHLDAKRKPTDPSKLSKKLHTALGMLRSWLLRRWKRKVEIDFIQWFHGSEHVTDPRHDIEARGWKALVHVRRCSWWEWDGGSSILFWRWPVEYFDDSIYGVVPRFIGEPPTYFTLHPPITIQW